MKKLYYFIIQKTLPQFFASLFKAVLHLLIKTCRVEVFGLEDFKESQKDKACILALWHSRLAIAPELLKKFADEFRYAALISRSRDGEIISTVVESYPQAISVRVSHNARFAGLKEAILEVKKERRILVITPDGPKGPPKKVKPGLARAQSMAEALVIPLSWSASSCFTLSTWDKMQVPKPFSKIKVVFGKPIFSDVQETSLKVEEGLLLADELSKFSN